MQHSDTKSSTAVAVIPARGGSKRIALKSIRDFHGKPMIAYAIEVARSSNLFDRIVVSTDNDEIAEVARSYAAEVPFMRPSELSDDHVATQPVIKHAIEALGLSAHAEASQALVCCIYPAVPFLLAEDLRRSYHRLCASLQTQYVFAVTSYNYPIYRALHMDDSAGGAVSMVYPQHEKTRSQDLPEAWHDAGQYYWGRATAWCDGTSIFSTHSTGQPLPRYRAIDIDTPEDWHEAELLYRSMRLDREAGV